MSFGSLTSPNNKIDYNREARNRKPLFQIFSNFFSPSRRAAIFSAQFALSALPVVRLFAKTTTPKRQRNQAQEFRRPPQTRRPNAETPTPKPQRNQARECRRPPPNATPQRRNVNVTKRKNSDGPPKRDGPNAQPQRNQARECRRPVAKFCRRFQPLSVAFRRRRSFRPPPSTVNRQPSTVNRQETKKLRSKERSFSRFKRPN